jgi:hypothetical protein
VSTGTPSRRPLLRWHLILPVGLIVLGGALTVFFGVRAARSFQELQYIREQGLDRGTATVDAIRAWMSIRFVAITYAVPEEYLHTALEIPFDPRNADRPLGRLNRDYDLGWSSTGDYPAIIDQVKAAVTAFRADPVATGLRDVRAWMSIRYIANTSGVPEADIVAGLAIAVDGKENIPLEFLADELQYPGGLKALIDDIRQALPEDQRGPPPPPQPPR